MNKSVFRLKQGYPGHNSPVICLITPLEEVFCPVEHVQEYLSTSSDCCSSQTFFIIAVPLHRVVARQLFAQVFHWAGIEASLGSVCAVVVSIGL